tara:strand:+ start:3152 stop:3328 length:177 start_codon:yes stop_codon:yes gene_type:complete
MIVRALDGSIVEVKRSDYKDDKDYYETIVNVALGKRFGTNKAVFTDKVVNIIKKRPYM